jgi:HlyD family type I secretion membrane fusion protein
MLARPALPAPTTLPAEPMMPPPISDSVRGPATVGLIVFIGFFLFVMGFTFFAPLDSAVVTVGFVKIETNRKAVQHREGGVVRELLVREGDRVEEGQVLVRLNDTELRAQVDILSGQHDALKALEARLLAERDDRGEIRFDPSLVAHGRKNPDVLALMDNQERLFRARLDGLKGQTSILEQRIAQLNEQIRGHRAQFTGTEEQLKFIRDELEGNRYLLEKGLVPKTKVLALERAQAQLVGQRGELNSFVSRAEQQIGEARMQILQLRRDRLTEVSDQLRETSSRLFDIEPRLVAARDQLERTEIKSPSTGAVVGLTAHTVGGVIGPGQKVLEVVPLDAAIEIEGQIRPQDADDVRPGMAAVIQASQITRRLVPYVEGTVTRVSADRIVDERSGVSYYLVAVGVDAVEFRKRTGILLQPGMPLDLTIRIQARTVFDFIVAPLTRALDKSMRSE